MKLDEHAFFARDLSRDYPIADKGKGSWIWDESGNKYLDACAGANVSGIGHGVREIADAIRAQAETLAYAPPQHFLNRPTIELCEKILSLAPKQYTRVMLCSSCSEAIENAMKIARQYHVFKGDVSKYRMISRWQGFHGNTISADAVSGSMARRSICAPMLMDVTHIDHACCYRCASGKNYPECGITCAARLEQAIIYEGPENISAFLCETIVGAASPGVTPVPEYYPMIRKICDEHDVLWISDEIMSGAGRTGRFLAAEHWQALPDIAVLAKGLACGYVPLSAILITEKVFDVFRKSGRPYIGGHTFNAHPVTAAAGLAVLNYIETNGIIDEVEGKGETLGSGLKHIADSSGIVGDVRGKGLMWGLEFIADKNTRAPFAKERNVSLMIMFEAMKRSLLVYPVQGGCANGAEGDAILICPPLNISDNDIQFLLDILGETILSVESELEKNL